MMGWNMQPLKYHRINLGGGGGERACEESLGLSSYYMYTYFNKQTYHSLYLCIDSSVNFQLEDYENKKQVNVYTY